MKPPLAVGKAIAGEEADWGKGKGGDLPLRMEGNFYLFWRL